MSSDHDPYLYANYGVMSILSPSPQTCRVKRSLGATVAPVSVACHAYRRGGDRQGRTPQGIAEQVGAKDVTELLGSRDE